MTAWLALAALGMFYLMYISDGIGSATRERARPTSTERGPAGYYALAQWLQRSGLRSVSLRERYGWLEGPGNGISESGNLLVVTVPAPMEWRTEELAALERWLRKGNTLLVMAALCDQTEWGVASPGGSSSSLQDLSGIELETVPQRQQRLHPRKPDPSDSQQRRRSPRMLAVPLRLSAEPAAQHPVFAGVHSIAAFSDYPRESWSARLPYDGFMLQVLRDRATSEGVLWTRLLGSGRIWVSAYGSVLTNRVIAEADNAVWMANLLAQSLGPRGTVIFDDMHQGISAAYDGRKFYSDRRLWISLAVLFLVWLCWVLGATRLRTPRYAIAAPRAADLVRAGGGLLSRRLTPQAAALRMTEHLPDETRLDLQQQIATADLAQLRRIIANAQAGRRVSLVDLHNLLLRIGPLR